MLLHCKSYAFMLRYVPFCGAKDGLLQCGLTWGKELSGRVRV